MAGFCPENAATRTLIAHGRIRGGIPYGWLTRRRDFLRAANGNRSHQSAFVLQSVKRQRAEFGAAPVDAGVRFGLTVTKKNGNAVVRNRIKRRLRAALSAAWNGELASNHTDPVKSELAVLDGHDYVIVARPDALTAPFEALVQDLHRAAKQVHRGRQKRTRTRDGKTAAMRNHRLQ